MFNFANKLIRKKFLDIKKFLKILIINQLYKKKYKINLLASRYLDTFAL